MKNINVFIPALLLIQTISISAQSLVSGRITDKDSMPMVSATVLLLSHPDSIYITGTVSDQDGRFELPNLKYGKYILSFSMIGFKNKHISMATENNNARIFLEDIILEEDMHILSEVVIIGKRDAIELEADKTTINVGSTIFGIQGSIFDALKTMPGIFVKEDGAIILNGQSGITIMINGRPTFLSGESWIFRRYPASDSGDTRPLFELLFSSLYLTKLLFISET